MNGQHWHYMNGLTGGYIPDTNECLRDMSDADAATYWRDRIDQWADDVHMGDVECTPDSPCDACSALMVADSVIADGDYLPHGYAVMVTEWGYASLERVECYSPDTCDSEWGG